jgi:quercetin dioxygenase-like cupin family protein
MQHVRLAIGILSIVFSGTLAARLIPVEQAAPAANPTPLVLASGEGERREFRTRPGVTFTIKADPRNGGSDRMTVVTEDMAPGDRIPTHRHPHADELLFILSGTGRVTLGDKVQVAQAGAIVFIPSDTWISLENIGKDHLTQIGVWSAPGYEDYMRAISVPAGEPVTPLSKEELIEIRKKYLHFGIYQ